VRSIIATAFIAVIFAAAVLPVAAQGTPPVFLFSLEGKGVPTRYNSCIQCEYRNGCY